MWRCLDDLLVEEKEVPRLISVSPAPSKFLFQGPSFQHLAPYYVDRLVKNIVVP